MRDMIDQVIANMPESKAKTIAMLIFLVLFVIIVIRTYRRSRKKHYERMARLPLEDGGKDE
jgi:cbb3-type cytochrome oxidase subunit 3